MVQRQKELKALEDEAAGIKIASDEDMQSYVEIRKVWRMHHSMAMS